MRIILGIWTAGVPRGLGAIHARRGQDFCHSTEKSCDLTVVWERMFSPAVAVRCASAHARFGEDGRLK